MRKLRLYFVRHGQTFLNKYGRMQGWSDSPLTPAGILQAEKLGAFLADTKFITIYSSDFHRTLQTAQIIRDFNNYNENLEIKITAGLRETFFGSFEGEKNEVAWGKIAAYAGCKSIKVFFDRIDQAAALDYIHEADEMHDAENYKTCWTRISSCLDQIVAETESDRNTNNDSKNINLLMVTHGNVIRTLAHSLDPSLDTKAEIFHSGVTLIDVEQHHYFIRKYNEKV